MEYWDSCFEILLYSATFRFIVIDYFFSTNLLSLDKLSLFDSYFYVMAEKFFFVMAGFSLVSVLFT